MQKSIIHFLTSFLLVINLFIPSAFSATKMPILEGVSVPATTYPYVGLISVGDYICTGTLVSSKYLLSAAHCFYDANNQKMTNFSGVTVTLNNQVFEVANVTIHPAYVSRSDDACLAGETDASIIELKTEATGVAPIALKRSAPTVGTELLLVGYGVQGTGLTGEDDTFPGEGYVNYGHTVIESVDGTYVNWTFDSDSNEVNTGGGDSGGPAFVDIDGVRYIDSITCGGTGNSGYDTTSSNTRADLIASWMDSVLAGNTGTPPTAPSNLVIDSVVVNLVDEDAYSLLIKGKVTLAKNFAPNKVAVKLTTDQARTSFKLDKNGAWSNRRGYDYFKMNGKLSRGKFTAAKVGFVAALGDSDAVYDNLISLFPEDAANGEIVQFPIQVTVKKVVYTKTVNMRHNGSSGVWKSVR